MKIKINNKLEERTYAELILCYEECEIISSVNNISRTILKLRDRGYFTGKLGEVKNLYLTEEDTIVILLGLGKKGKLENERFRKNIGKAIRKAKKDNLTNINIYLTNDLFAEKFYETIKNLTEAVVMGNYEFDVFLSNKPKKIEEIHITTSCDKEDVTKNAVREGKILGDNTCSVRDLVNIPASMKTPQQLADSIEEMLRDTKVKVQIYNKKEIEELGMTAFLEVSRGSDVDPALIVLEYFGDKENKDKVTGVVGKCITYDSGGLSLKPPKALPTMQLDMAGGAALVGAMKALAQLNEKINVIGVIPACENMISQKAYKPGDIINTLKGTTVFIESSDAEGRLTLIDGIQYLIKYKKVSSIVDIATLTGTAKKAYGPFNCAAAVNDKNLERAVLIAGEKSGERVCKMPINDEYSKFLKYDRADIKNSSDGCSGMISAAMFLKEFTDDKPWLHIDIAGMAWANAAEGYNSQGATGYGVRLLYHLLKEI